ncbi:MAG: AAA family ATPase [Pirellulales bacterium]|nr:AAA family ATPase [Pirellulales bacterium]
MEPDSFLEAALTDSELEGLILKYLNARSEATGRDISDQLKLPFRLIDPLLLSMKTDRLVAHRGASMMNDFVFELTDLGRERARKLSQLCTYFGSAPVSLQDYIASISAQSITHQQPTEDDLRNAFSDLLINQRMFHRLGPAINSGRGLFLFGPPGNGKTSIAERVTKAFGESIWIPRSLGVDGEMIRLFDPSMHDEIPLEEGCGLIHQHKIDQRWVRIRRPTIVVGGELTMDSLEVTLNTATNVSEAPIQMKSNCGTLVIDDFGRQRMTTDELLNRWIVPLEKRFDYLNLSSGKKIQVPFDQLIIFSTNLEPRDLVDDAFLRRIPYKIEVPDPSEEEFRTLFKMMAPVIGVQYEDEPLEYLIKKHYKASHRPFRCCQPRDLLSQIRNYCLYIGEEPRMTNDYLDYAVENYFAVM